MSYIIPLFIIGLLPAVLGLGIEDIFEDNGCEELYAAMVDAMKITDNSSYFFPQNFFADLGLSTENAEQLKTFACKLPDIQSVRELAEISPSGNLAVTTEKYMKMRNIMKDPDGIRGIKMIRMLVAVNEGARKYLPANVLSLPWNTDKEDAVTFFSGLVREFGVDFPTFFLQAATIFEGKVFDMTDPRQFANAMFEYNNVNDAAIALGISQDQLATFLEFVNIITTFDAEALKFFKRSQLLIDRLNAIGFFDLSLD